MLTLLVSRLRSMASMDVGSDIASADSSAPASPMSVETRKQKGLMAATLQEFKVIHISCTSG